LTDIPSLISRLKHRRAIYKAALALGVSLAVCACAPRIEQRGNHPDEDQVVQINPGIDDKNHVEQLLGTPSAMSSFNDKTWYYISKLTSQTAFFDPEVIDQEILAITFNDDNIVENMKVYGKENGQMVELVERTTPTEGNDLTLIQQLLGNLGRFNAPPKSASPYSN